MNPKPSRKFSSNDVDDAVLINLIAEQKRGNAQNSGLADRVSSQRQLVRQLSARLDRLKAERQVDSVIAASDELELQLNMESAMLNSTIDEQRGALNSISAINSLVPELRTALIKIGYKQKHIIEGLKR